MKTYFQIKRLCTKTRFEKEVQDNSEMAYWTAKCSVSDTKKSAQSRESFGVLNVSSFTHPAKNSTV